MGLKRQRQGQIRVNGYVIFIAVLIGCLWWIDGCFKEWEKSGRRKNEQSKEKEVRCLEQCDKPSYETLGPDYRICMYKCSGLDEWHPLKN